jgi:GT2 family glycosyltransferase/glycosyltransferase involved in cell wall biosynthesis
MYRFWSMVIKPVFEALRPETVVEVGSDHGPNTRNLAEWCVEHGATLHVIDPLPKYDVDEWLERYGGTLVFHRSLSLNALGRIGPADAVLIDGDHNWYTVYHELELVKRQARKAGVALPVVLLHDVLWPYGRRDLYYDPETIPEAYRQPYARRGMRPDTPDLLEKGGLNAHLWNSIYENDLRNGVMTAVEDFVAQVGEPVEFVVLPAIHGLGMIVPRARSEQRPELADLLAELTLAARVRELVEMVEGQRLETEIRLQESRAEAREAAEERRRRLGELQEKLRGQAERAREFEERLGAERAAHAGTRDELRAQGKTLQALEAAHEGRQRELERTRAEAERLRGEADGLRTEAKGLRERLTDATGKRGELEQRYRRLAGRRAVRLALWLAGFFRPLFRLVRRARGRRPGTGGSHAERGERGERKPDPERETSDPLAALAAARPVSVIVPVHNAPGAVERCLASVARNTPRTASVLVIDDCSTDPAVGPVLAAYADRPGFRLLRNDENLGFVRTVNRGIAETSGDVVILNSDTEVGPHWLRNLAVAAYRRERVGTVTPLSTNAGVFSAPSAAGDNRWPDGLSFDEAARLVARNAEHASPRTPTGHGFCLYVRRAVFEEVGLLDAEAFPRGYGEETDLCMRAAAAGFTHVVDDGTYVFHERGSSFGAERDELIRSSRTVIDERYPDYTARVQALKASPELSRARQRVAEAFELGALAARERALFVLHTGTGGTPQTNLDLMQRLQERYETLLLTIDGRNLRLFDVVGREREQVGSWQLDKPWNIVDTSREDYRRTFAEVLLRHDIDIVHIRHLLGHTLDAPDVCRRMGVPVLMSLHDFYMACPTIHLLDEQDRYCGGVCTPGAGTCRIPTKRLGDVPPLKHAWVHEWHRRVAEALRHVDALVTTSEDTRSVYRQVYPDLDVPFHVIEHGRDLVQRHGLARPPEPGGWVRVLVPGNLGVNKGANLIARLVEIDRGRRLEFHFLGATPPGFERYGVVHGTYERGEFDRRVAEIAPSFMGIFSIWPETYSHTLTEAWAAGVPVLASDIGVLRERVSKHGGGWLLDYADPERMYRQMLEIADDPEDYAREAARANLDGVRTTREMAADYERLYEVVLRGATLAGDPLEVRALAIPDEGEPVLDVTAR